MSTRHRPNISKVPNYSFFEIIHSSTKNLEDFLLIFIASEQLDGNILCNKKSKYGRLQSPATWMTNIFLSGEFPALRTGNLHICSIFSHLSPLESLPLQSPIKANVILSTRKIINSMQLFFISVRISLEPIIHCLDHRVQC